MTKKKLLELNHPIINTIFTKGRELKLEDLVDIWLWSFHETTINAIKDDYEKDENEEYYRSETKRFYTTYQVTQDQYDWWEGVAKDVMRHKQRVNKATVDRGWWSLSLNCAPMVKQEEDV